MSRSNLAWLLGIASVVLLGYAVSQSAPTQDKDHDYELVRLVVDVLDEVDHRYVRPLTLEEKRDFVENMVNGGLARLDPHSAFIGPKELKSFSQGSTGRFGGVGIQLEAESRASGALIVASPMVDTPAYEAGVLAGDTIVKVDGKSTENMHISDAVRLISGQPGTKVVLTLVRDGQDEPFDVALTRAEIHVPSVLGDSRSADNPKEWDFMVDKAEKIGYVRVTGFSEETVADLRAVLEKLEREGARGLIIDLRSNPGGLLRSAVDICRMFIADGRIVSTRGRDHEEEIYDAKGNGLLFQSQGKKFPIAVLINRYSASASEIVAAALQDHGRAVIVGERSFGKGSVQNVIKMEGDSSALKLTTASYWRPSGKNIHRFPDSKDTDEWGVKPDPGFEVTLKPAERRDYFNNRVARDRIKGKSVGSAGKPAKESTATADGKPFVDRVLERALEYMHAQLGKANAS
jgi:carboxyl-terminal processing protease